MIGTLAVDGLAVTFGIVMKGLAPPRCSVTINHQWSFETRNSTVAERPRNTAYKLLEIWVRKWHYSIDYTRVPIDVSQQLWHGFVSLRIYRPTGSAKNVPHKKLQFLRTRWVFHWKMLYDYSQA